MHLISVEIAALTRPIDSTEDIIRRASGHDAAAFADLVELHHPDVLRVCMVITKDAALAEGAAQETWTRVWRRLSTLHSADRFRAWLLAIAANEARQQFRRRRQNPGDAPLDTASDDPSYTVSDDFIEVMSGLGFDERRLLAFRFAVGMSSAEIGAALGISAGAARHRLKRVLDKLREDLA